MRCQRRWWRPQRGGLTTTGKSGEDLDETADTAEEMEALGSFFVFVYAREFTARNPCVNQAEPRASSPFCERQVSFAGGDFGVCVASGANGTKPIMQLRGLFITLKYRKVACWLIRVQFAPTIPAIGRYAQRGWHTLAIV